MDIITEMTTAQMVAEYNQLTGKSIKKFSDRKTGERQLASAREMAATKKLLSGTAAKPEAKPAKIEKPKAAPKPRVNIDGRSTSVAASWTDKKVAAARAIRTNVGVQGYGNYRSVKEAFEKLNLPLGKHIKFRMELKAEGKKSFEHEGKQYKFITVEQTSLAV